MSYTYPYQRPAARDATPQFESPLDAALRLLEKERSHEKRPNYPTPDRRGSCNESYRPRGTDETRPMNLFGRTFKETLSDFPKVVRSQTSRRDQRTPSLISDDSPSRSSSTSYTLSPFQGNYISPPTSPMSMRSSPASDYDVGPHHRSPFVLPDDRSSGSSSNSPSVASDGPYESHLGRRPSAPFKSHNAVGTYDLPKAHSKSRHVKAPAIKTIEDELEEQIDELWDDDDYIPEPQVLPPPSPSKAVWNRGSKVTGRFVCDLCGKSFTRNFDKGRHTKTIHGEPSMDDILSRSCPCGAVFSRGDAFRRHLKTFPECEALVRQNKTRTRRATCINSSRPTFTARV